MGCELRAAKTRAKDKGQQTIITHQPKRVFASMMFRLTTLSLLASAVVFSPVIADDSEYVTCGSAIKLTHYESSSKSGEQYFLNSEARNLGGGSGQQIVTSVPDSSTTNALWWVRGPNDPEARGDLAACSEGVGQPIPCGSFIRFTHLNSMKNLHSHNVKSPLSRQQEVSGFGAGDGNGDNGDDWQVVCKDKYWTREETVQFQHVDSGRYLGSSSTVKFTHQNCGHSCPIMNHLESFGRQQKDAFSVWVVELGVHVSR